MQFKEPVARWAIFHVFIDRLARQGKYLVVALDKDVRVDEAADLWWQTQKMWLNVTNN